MADDDKVTMYHYTNSGENDAVLTSLLANGGHVPSGMTAAANQKNGFYLMDRLIRDPDDDIFKCVTTQIGSPMIVTTRCRFGSGFELDYEGGIPLTTAIMSEFSEELAAIPPGKITLSSGHVITGVRVDEDEDGIEFELTRPGYQPRKIFFEWGEDMPMHYRGNIVKASEITDFLKKHKLGILDLKRLMGHEENLIQQLRDYLVEKCGNRYTDVEKTYITRMLRRNIVRPNEEAIHMKCTDPAFMEIVQIEVHRDGQWQKLLPDRAEPGTPAPVPA